MNQKKSKIVILNLGISLILGACSVAGNGSSSQPECSEKYCVEIELSEPIPFNQPFAATITVDPFEDISGLEINAFSDDPDASFSQTQWIVDAFSGQPIVVTTMVTLPREGYFRIYGNAITYTHGVANSILVQMTQSGGTPNPGSDGDASSFGESNYTQIYEAPTTVPKPTPFEAYLLNPGPEAALAACNFSHANPSEWSGAGASLSFSDANGELILPDRVAEGVELTITVMMQTPPDSPPNTRVKLGFCLPPSQTFFSSNDLTNGKKVWNIRTQPGQVYTKSITGQFTEAGVYSLPVTAFVQNSGDVYGRLPQVQVVASGEQTNSNGWELVFSEDFESLVWPWPPLTSKWDITDLSDDGYHRVWDNSDYKSRGGASVRAVWPAMGWDGIIPTPGDDNYFDNMDTRMAYGPFDLSDAEIAEVIFWQWYEIELDFDYLYLEISLDGISYQTVQSWTGYDQDWKQLTVDLSNYAGQSQVWIAWRFYSDYGITYDGPWVDDVYVWKYVPGDITVSGKIEHYDRSNNLVPSPYIRVYLYDEDPGETPDMLAFTTTDSNGNYAFPPITNWDFDDFPDQYTARLDLYILWETAFNDDNPGSSTNTRSVIDLDDDIYNWKSAVVSDIPDGIAVIDGNISLGDDDLGAMRIFQTLWDGWNFIDNQSLSPGSIIVQWEKDNECRTILGWPVCDSHFWPSEGVFFADSSVVFPNTINHEQGHQYMYNLTGEFWFSLFNLDDFNACVIEGHDFFVEKTPLCAYTEGWPDFFSVLVGGSATYKYSGGIIDLESPNVSPSVPTGDAVEGWVAAALYDLWDTAPDGYDQFSSGFSTIWGISQGNLAFDLDEFWQLWLTTYSSSINHFAIQSIYQNTIDYNDPPTMVIGDLNYFQAQFPVDNAVDLDLVTDDDVSLDSQLTWTLDLSGFDYVNCSIIHDSSNNLDLDINFPSFSGSCGQVVIDVDDGLETTTESFYVNVLVPTSKIFQPFIESNTTTQGYPPPSGPGAPPPSLPGMPPPGNPYP